MDELEQKFLAAIAANTNDVEARSVYADWLDERGDERGEYLRIEAQLNAGPPRLAELTARIDPQWLAAVTRRCDVMMLAPGNNKIAAIKAVREVTGLGLKEAKDLVDATMPQRVRADLSADEAHEIVARFGESDASMAVMPHVPESVVKELPPSTAPTSRLVILRIHSTQPVAAMAALRRATGVGLVEAKEIIDAVREGEARVVIPTAPFERIISAVAILRSTCDLEIRRA